MEKLRQLGRDDVVTSVVVQIELEYGAHLRGSKRLWRSVRGFLGGMEILPLGPEDTRHIARVAAELREKGRPIGVMDTLIAGHTISRDLTLVTHDTRHFSEVDGLRTEDWHRPEPQ